MHLRSSKKFDLQYVNIYIYSVWMMLILCIVKTYVHNYITFAHSSYFNICLGLYYNDYNVYNISVLSLNTYLSYTIHVVVYHTCSGI